MNILIANDDGVFAPGIQALAHALRPLGRVVIVAPESGWCIKKYAKKKQVEF